MTHERALEVIAVAVTTFATATSGAIALEASDVLIVLIGLGASAVSGYFAAHITTTSRLSSLETEMRSLRDEVHRYYQTRVPREPDA